MLSKANQLLPVALYLTDTYSGINPLIQRLLKNVDIPLTEV